MLAQAIPFVAIFMCGVVYVALAYAGGAWLARRHSLRVDRRFLLARLRWLALAVVVPGLLVACTEVAPSAAGPITSLVAALVMLCVSLLALLDGTITLQDHRRALVGRDLDGVTRRMRERAAKTRGGTTRLGVDAHVRQVLEDAGILLLAGLGEEALRFTAEELVTPIRMTEEGPPPLAPPDWAHAWAAALRALYALSEGRDPAAVAEALPSPPVAGEGQAPTEGSAQRGRGDPPPKTSSEEASTAALLQATRALARGMAGEWREAAASLPSPRPSERVAALVHDLVRAHCDALYAPERVRADLARVLPTALRQRALHLWSGPASRLDESPFRG